MMAKKELGNWVEEWSDLMKVKYPPDDSWKTAAQIAEQYRLSPNTARRRLRTGEDEGDVISEIYTPRKGGKPTRYYKRIKQK